MSRFRSVLLVGAGAMAEQEHLPRIRAFLQPQRLVLVEPSPRRRQELQGKLRTNETVHERLGSEQRFDVVIIASPPSVHAQCFQQYRNQSQCFLIEKPMCLSIEEASSIIEACRQDGLKATVCLPRRKFRHFRLLRDILECRRFGEFRGCNLYEGRVFAWDASYAYFDRALSGGGVLADIGPHAVDQLLQLFPRLTLESCEMDCESSGIEANVLAQFREEQGRPVSLCLSRNRYLSETLQLRFEAATITAGLRHEKLTLHVPSGEFSLTPDKPRDFSKGLDLVYREALLGEENFGMTPADSISSTEIIEQCYRQSTTMSQDWAFSR